MAPWMDPSWRFPLWRFLPWRYLWSSSSVSVLCGSDRGGSDVFALASIGHFYEGKACGLCGVPVSHDVHSIDRSLSLEQGSNRIFGSPEAPFSHQNLAHFV